MLGWSEGQPGVCWTARSAVAAVGALGEWACVGCKVLVLRCSGPAAACWELVQRDTGLGRQMPGCSFVLAAVPAGWLLLLE